MIHLIYGKNEYRIRDAIARVREELAEGDPVALAANTSVLDGRSLAPQELLAHATAAAFLAPSRLVIVEGLLTSLAQVKGGRRKKNATAEDPLEPWRQAAATLGNAATMPETTTLIFVEGDLAKTNPAFTIFAPIARTVEFGALTPQETIQWLKDWARQCGLKLTDGAIRALAQAVGGDLWTLEHELQKLGAYANGDVVDEKMVAELVSAAQETKMWDLTDAVVAGNERKAVGAMQRLLTDGVVPPILSSMIVRQYRQLAIVKEMREARAPQDSIARGAGIPPFKVGDVSALAGRYSWNQLRDAYRLMLDADLSVKRGLQDDESSLQLLVHELCAIAPGVAVRPAYSR